MPKIAEHVFMLYFLRGQMMKKIYIFSAKGTLVRNINVLISGRFKLIFKVSQVSRLDIKWQTQREAGYALVYL